MMRLFIISATEFIVLPNQASSRTDLHIPTPNHSPRPGWISYSNSQLKGQLMACYLLYLALTDMKWSTPMSSLGVDLRDWKVRVSCLDADRKRKRGGLSENLQKPSKRHGHTARGETGREGPVKPCGTSCPGLGFCVSSPPSPPSIKHRRFLPGFAWVNLDILYPEDHG